MKRNMYHRYTGRQNHPVRSVILILVGLGIFCFGLLEICIAVFDGRKVPDEPDVMVVLGCQVMDWGPSVLLQDRLDTALEYLEEYPDLPVVVSGGQGPNEPISEAQSMYGYLVEQGVEPDRIILEDQSHNTMQNLLYTRAILEGEGRDLSSENVVMVSNGFHLARICMLAGRFGYEQVYTLDAPSSHWPSAVKMFFREPLALVKSFVFDWE